MASHEIHMIRIQVECGFPDDASTSSGRPRDTGLKWYRLSRRRILVASPQRGFAIMSTRKWYTNRLADRRLVFMSNIFFFSILYAVLVYATSLAYRGLTTFGFIQPTWEIVRDLILTSHTEIKTALIAAMVTFLIRSRKKST